MGYGGRSSGHVKNKRRIEVLGGRRRKEEVGKKPKDEVLSSYTSSYHPSSIIHVSGNHPGSKV